MVKSTVTSITPATHADLHRHGGSDPLTGDVRVDHYNSRYHIDGTKVVDNTSVPNVWTDLDLSAVVGAASVVVVLKIKHRAAAQEIVGIRQNGDTDDFYATDNFGGVNRCYMNGVNKSEVIMCETDATGIIETKSANTHNLDVWVLGYWN